MIKHKSVTSLSDITMSFDINFPVLCLQDLREHLATQSKRTWKQRHHNSICERLYVKKQVVDSDKKRKKWNDTHKISLDSDLNSYESYEEGKV